MILVDRTVGTVTRLQTGQLRFCGSFPCKGKRHFPSSKYPDSGTHLTYYSMDTGSNFTRSKVAGA